jgi:hypothetical protein
LELAGSVEIAGFSAEPECWVKIGASSLQPDLYVDFNKPSVKLWLEVDMATEGQKQIKDKLQRYWMAFNDADDSEWPEFPLVMFVAVDDERAKELRWLIDSGLEEAQALFRVSTIKTLPTFFT